MSRMEQIRVAVVGAGVMGANHARVVADSPRTELSVVIDRDGNRAEQLADRYGVPFGTDIGLSQDCDIAIVATNTPAHHDIASQLIGERIPVLVEKPISTAFDEVEKLCAAARERSVPMMCGFVERFNPVVNTASALLSDEPIHIVTMRHSPVTPRIADSVVYDLLIHDIDLALRLMPGREVSRVSGMAWEPDVPGTAEIADCIIQFDNGAIATLSASRAGQRKLRNVQVFTQTTLADLDLLRADLTMYRNVMQEQKDDSRALTYRAETIIDIPFVRHPGEPLALQLDYFLDLVAGQHGLSDELDSILGSHRIAQQVEDSTSAQPKR